MSDRNAIINMQYLKLKLNLAYLCDSELLLMSFSKKYVKGEFIVESPHCFVRKTDVH